MSAAFIGAIGTVLAAVATVVVGWFVVRTDRASKMTQANMQDQQYVLRLVGVLRDDLWAVLDWAYAARTLHPTLPPIPKQRHREMEAEHNREANASE